MSIYKLGDGTYSDQYKVGDKFVFTGDFGLAYSQATEDELLGVYELIFDDGSSCPKFRSEVSGRSYYEEWRLLSKYSPAQTVIETEPTDDLQSELTEAYAKIESLESALEDAVREIFSLKHQLIAKAANTCLGVMQGESQQFKPISEMTYEDWLELYNSENSVVFWDSLGRELTLEYLWKDSDTCFTYAFEEDSAVYIVQKV